MRWFAKGERSNKLITPCHERHAHIFMKCMAVEKPFKHTHTHTHTYTPFSPSTSYFYRCIYTYIAIALKPHSYSDLQMHPHSYSHPILTLGSTHTLELTLTTKT